MRRSLTCLVVIIVLAACGDGGDRDEVRTADSTTSLTFRLGRELTGSGVGQLTSILENRLDALGAPDASVTVDENEVIVKLPESVASRVRDAADVLGTTAELRFRPVLQAVPLGDDVPLIVTPPEDDIAMAAVVLDEPGEGRYRLGPAQLIGSIVEDANAQLDQAGQWLVALTLREDGIVAFNEQASECFERSAVCPTGQLAIVLDSEVRSAPTVQQGSFERDGIVISGEFTEAEAKDLALVLRYGALPTSLELVVASSD